MALLNWVPSLLFYFHLVAQALLRLELSLGIYKEETCWQLPGVPAFTDLPSVWGPYLCYLCGPEVTPVGASHLHWWMTPRFHKMLCHFLIGNLFLSRRCPSHPWNFWNRKKTLSQ